jgi:hypothetical protein
VGESESSVLPSEEASPRDDPIKFELARFDDVHEEFITFHVISSRSNCGVLTMTHAEFVAFVSTLLGWVSPTHFVDLTKTGAFATEMHKRCRKISSTDT